MTMTLNRGTNRVHLSEQIARHRMVLNGPDFDVHISRDATLTDDLSSVQSRVVRGIQFVTRPGFDDEQVVTFTRGGAVALRNALEAAIRATDDEEWQ